MNELIQQARELCDAATPGPWRYKETADYSEIYDNHSWGKALSPLAMVGSNLDDAAFISEARTLVPQMCDALEAAKKENDTLRQYAEFIKANAVKISLPESEYIDVLTAHAEKAEAENRWIPVSERLPKKPPDYFKDGHWWMVSGEDFIVVDSDGKVYEAHWTYGCSCQNYFWYVNSLTPLTNITHWRPLPEPPKGE